MELFCIEYDSQEIRLTVSDRLTEACLLVNGAEIARQRDPGLGNRYPFELPGVGWVTLTFTLQPAEGLVHVALWQDQQLLQAYQQPLPLKLPQASSMAASEAPSVHPVEGLDSNHSAGTARGHLWAWLGVAFKLLKSIKVVQVALVGMSLSAWGILYSWEFALAIVGILVFHEYGHLRAMQKFGIPTKGIYLIPFVGGLAVGDSPKTHWQEVYVAMMGPFYGLLMVLLFGLGYMLTDNHFMGLVTSIGALVNLFNLLPVLPLDGGRVVKAMALSGQRKSGLITVGLLSVGGLIMAFKLGLGLLIFFLVLGLLDLIASWRQFEHDPMVVMNNYGVSFSLVWYLATSCALIAIILLMAGTGLPGTEIAARVLQD